MAIEMRPLSEGTGQVELVTATQHWYLTEDHSKVVPEGHQDARWLWAAPGDEVPRDEAERLGAVRPAGDEVKADEPEEAQGIKAQGAPADKRRERSSDKGR